MRNIDLPLTIHESEEELLESINSSDKSFLFIDLRLGATLMGWEELQTTDKYLALVPFKMEFGKYKLQEIGKIFKGTRGKVFRIVQVAE